MPKITYIEATGRVHVVEVAVGDSVMEGARSNGVRGILAECGGCCICGTCHVYIEPEWREQVGGPRDIEVATMEFSENVAPFSRLACQIKVTEELDGLVVRVVND